MSGSNRSLAAIMFTDIVGYTRLAQADEALSLDLLEEHRRLIRPLFSPHGGTEVKTIGDAFMVEFRSALEAVLCAVAVQQAVHDRNSKAPPGRRLELRVGIHLGDVVHGSGDIHGDAVNVASRVEPLAEPGGICITQQVYDHVRNKTGLTISKVGEIELKNVELPVGVYKIEMSWSTSQSQGGSAPRERLAVLPFVNISPDPNDEYFADGLTEELISKLSGVGELKVIARTSVMNYKKKEKKISDIGRELAVGSIIEGSVRKAGNRIRVTVQLIDAHTEEHLWASNYDNELDDIFAIQSDVAAKVAGSISAGVFTKAVRKDTDDVEAYTMYMRAMHLLHEPTEKNLREAVSLLERAISKDQAFVRAHAALARAWAVMASGGYEGFEVVTSKGEPEARKALELGPDWADSHAAMALIDGMLDRFEDETRHAEKAIEINPNLPEGYLAIGIVRSGYGDLEGGLAAFRKAYELDPLSYSAANFLALVLRVSGKYAEALRILERMKEFAPKNAGVYIGLAEYHMLQREFGKAQEFLDLARELKDDENTLLLNQGVLYALTGKRDEAEELIRKFMDDQKESVGLYGQLFVNAALGNLDQAFKVLMRQAETHSWPFLVKTLPVFEGMRNDPRFAEFCLKVGIPA